MKTTEKQLKALRAICNVLIPSIEGDAYWQRKASDFKVVERMMEQISHLSEREQKEFKQLLSLISSRTLGLTWRGRLKPANDLSEEQLERMLKKWSHSRFKAIRKGYNTIKRLCGFVYYGATEDGVNPNWEAIDYQMLSKMDESSTHLLEGMIVPRKNQQLAYDVVIVGSGAGGSVAASILAEAGQSVLIIEKGPFLKGKDFNQVELDMLNKLYEGRGLLSSVDGGVSVFAGSCLGGGTTVNWAGAFRTPDYILEEWAKEHDNPHFLEADYNKGFDFVEKRNHISTDLIKHNPQNQSLYKGAQKLDWNVKLIPRNVRKPEALSDEFFWKSQGFSPLGDRYGSKQCALQTALSDAVEKGAHVLYDTTVLKVLTSKGIAQGVEVVSKEKDKWSIRAKQVIVSAGSIHTPAILKRSGLRHKEIGRNLYIHPTVPLTGFYNEKSYSWYGPMMSAVVDEFTRKDGNYGFKIETPPVHLGLMSTVANWRSGRHYKQDMLEASYAQHFIILTRDKFGGRIKVDKKGNPLIYYQLHDFDKKHLIMGMQKGVELHHVNEAEKIYVYHNQALIYERGRDDINFMLNEIPRRKWETNYFGMFSAHQMGTCRMGGSNKKHPVKPNGETREVKNLFVADGSLFPSASGANPMLSIQALAYYVAQQIKK